MQVRGPDMSREASRVHDAATLAPSAVDLLAAERLPEMEMMEVTLNIPVVAANGRIA